MRVFDTLCRKELHGKFARALDVIEVFLHNLWISISRETGARNLTVLSERISKIDISVVGSNYKLSQYYKIYFLCYGDFGGGVASRWKSHLVIFTYFSLDFKLGGELMNICLLRFQSGGTCQCFRTFILTPPSH